MQYKNGTGVIETCDKSFRNAISAASFRATDLMTHLFRMFITIVILMTMCQ